MAAMSNYFSQLNYSLANEDTRLELGICEQTKPRSILSVCGSGGRFLPLLAAHPDEIIAIDLAEQQLALAELRQAAIIACEFEDFCLFFGFPPYGVDAHDKARRAIFERLDLSEETRAYFANLFHQIGWRGLIYEGKWEKTFIKVPRLLRRFVGTAYDTMFEFCDKDQQDRYLAKKLNSRLWKLLPRLVILMVGNATFFNAMLYGGNFVRKNIGEGFYSFYRKAYRRLFVNGLARENFFLQLVFLGKLRYPEGNPIEAQAATYQKMRDALRSDTPSRVVRQRGDVLSYAAECRQKFDFISLSDVPSYFKGPDEQSYLQRLQRCLNPGALVVVRCYLHIPENTDTTGYDDVSHEYAELIRLEKVQVYQIFVYRYRGDNR